MQRFEVSSALRHIYGSLGVKWLTNWSLYKRGCETVYSYKVARLNVTLTLEYSSIVKKVNQSHYRPEVPRRFQEAKVPTLRDNGPGWW